MEELNWSNSWEKESQLESSIWKNLNWSTWTAWVEGRSAGAPDSSPPSSSASRVLWILLLLQIFGSSLPLAPGVLGYRGSQPLSLSVSLSLLLTRVEVGQNGRSHSKKKKREWKRAEKAVTILRTFTIFLPLDTGEKQRENRHPVHFVTHGRTTMKGHTLRKKIKKKLVVDWLSFPFFPDSVFYINVVLVIVSRCRLSLIFFFALELFSIYPRLRRTLLLTN